MGATIPTTFPQFPAIPAQLLWQVNPELKGSSQQPDRKETLCQLDSDSIPLKLPREVQLGDAHRVAFRGVGHLGIPADIHLDLADNLGVQFRAGLHSQGPVATDDGSIPLIVTPKHLTITLHPRYGGTLTLL